MLRRVAVCSRCSRFRGDGGFLTIDAEGPRGVESVCLCFPRCVLRFAMGVAFGWERGPIADRVQGGKGPVFDRVSMMGVGVPSDVVVSNRGE